MIAALQLCVPPSAVRCVCACANQPAEPPFQNFSIRHCLHINHISFNSTHTRSIAGVCRDRHRSCYLLERNNSCHVGVPVRTCPYSRNDDVMCNGLYYCLWVQNAFFSNSLTLIATRKFIIVTLRYHNLLLPPQLRATVLADFLPPCHSFLVHRPTTFPFCTTA